MLARYKGGFLGKGGKKRKEKDMWQMTALVESLMLSNSRWELRYRCQEDRRANPKDYA